MGRYSAKCEAWYSAVTIKGTSFIVTFQCGGFLSHPHFGASLEALSI